jgi:transcriptional regulator with XRE-family HTH domain
MADGAFIPSTFSETGDYTPAQRKKSPRGRLASGAPNPVDVHIGKRVRLRRMMIGLSQEEVAESIGVAFQQIQKYECAVNRISTSRLWSLAKVLHCPVTFFYESIDDKTAAASPRHLASDAAAEAYTPAQDDLGSSQETLKLVRAYFSIKHPDLRRQILDLTGSLAKATYAPGLKTE